MPDDKNQMPNPSDTSVPNQDMTEDENQGWAGGQSEYGDVGSDEAFEDNDNDETVTGELS